MGKQPTEEVERAGKDAGPVKDRSAAVSGTGRSGRRRPDPAGDSRGATNLPLENLGIVAGLAISIITSIITSILLPSDAAFQIAFWLWMALVGVGFFIYFRGRMSLGRGLGFAGMVALTALMAYTLHDVVTQPRFTIQIPGSQQTIKTQRILWLTLPTSIQVEPFEVTDLLIDSREQVTRTKADRERMQQESIDRGQTPPDAPAFTDGLHLTVYADYEGTKSIPRVAVRVTGKDKDQPIVKTIWDPFTENSTQAEVEITIPEIVEASQIARVSDDPATNLNLEEHPFPESEITLEIIDEMNPTRPLSSPVKIKIQNSPWAHHASIVHRGRDVFVDYALKNLGREGRFYYHTVVTKITEEVEATESPVWSGTTQVYCASNQEEIVLKPGESAVQSIPLPDFPKGRYVVEIYTVKQQDRVRFDQEVSWSSFPFDYVYSSIDKIMLLVDCSDLDKTCDESVVFPVEKGSPVLYAFDGRSEGRSGEAEIGFVGSDPVSGEEMRYSNTYALEYALDPQTPGGYAGMSLKFENPQDLSSYQNVRMVIRLARENAHILFRLTSVKDGDQKQYQVEMGNGAYGKNTTDEQTVEIPLSLYREKGVDLTSVSFLTFIAYESPLPGGEFLTFYTRQIEFIR